MTRAAVVMMMRGVRAVAGDEGAGERAGRLYLARAEADVETGVIDHRHEADGHERAQRERGQQHEREERCTPPRR